MQATTPLKEENHPFLQLLILVLSAIVGLIVVGLAGYALCVVIYGFDLLKSTEWTTGTDSRYIGALKILIVAQQIGLFLIPAIVLGIFEGKKPQNFYGMKAPKLEMLGLVFLIMLVSTPFLGKLAEWNAGLHLPNALQWLESWMRKLEDQGAVTTKAILKGVTISALISNLLLVAVVPAICEELIFRGGLQRTLLRLIKNPHIGIWTSAIIFSTIHFQFFGFFPRLILGAMFGYIYFYTGSIWYTVFAHFLNNGYAVVVTWYLQTKNMPIEKADEMTMPIYAALISAVLTLALFKFLQQKTQQKELIANV